MPRQMRAIGLMKALLVLISVCLCAAYWRIDWDQERAGRLAFILADAAIPAIRESACTGRPLDLRGMWKLGRVVPESSEADHLVFRDNGLKCTVKRLRGRNVGISIVIGDPYILRETVHVMTDGRIVVRRMFTDAPIHSLMQVANGGSAK